LTFGDDGEKIEGDGTDLTVTSSNDVTIDAAGSIFLSADGNGLVDFKDGDTTYLRVAESSNAAILKNMISDGDFLIKGNDGGSEVTALTFDMSAAGAATFNSTVQATGFNIGGTAITSTAAELNIMDGDTSASSTTLVDADRLVTNDAGTMKQVALTDVKTYLSSAGFSSDDPTALAIALG